MSKLRLEMTCPHCDRSIVFSTDVEAPPKLERPKLDHDDPRGVQAYFGALGAAVREERTRLGMSVEDLAEIAGCAPNTVWRIERGESTTVGMLWWIAEALDCNLSVLLELAETEHLQANRRMT